MSFLEKKQTSNNEKESPSTLKFEKKEFKPLEFSLPNKSTKETSKFFPNTSSTEKEKPLDKKKNPKKKSVSVKSFESYFANDHTRELLLSKMNLTLQSIDPSNEISKVIPKNIKEYHSFYPLDESIQAQKSKVFHIPTDTFKVISSSTGKAYVIKRVLKNETSIEDAIKILASYKDISHPNIVSFKKCLLANEFQKDLCLVYDYHPASFTLEYKYFIEMVRAPPEEVLWSYICQIVSGLKVIHSLKLACRSIHVSKILLSGKRILINNIGMMDILHPVKNVEEAQQADLDDFGTLLIALCKCTLDTIESSNYSSELIQFIKYLKNKEKKTITQIIEKIVHRILDEMVNLERDVDYLEDELTKELENGRLFRLLVKLNFVFDKPEFESNYNESGDKYVIKLFYDYLFNQQDYFLNFAHIVESLNKLDCGAQDKILLMSRDEQNLVVVSFKELKQTIINAFNDLTD